MPSCSKAMAKRPDDRFASAGAFAEALRAAIAEPTGATQAEDEATLMRAPRPPAAPTRTAPVGKPPPSAAAPGKSRLPLLAGVAALVVLVLAGTGWFLTRPAAPPPAQLAETTPAPSAPAPAAPSVASDAAPVETKPAGPAAAPTITPAQSSATADAQPAPTPPVQPAEPAVAPAPAAVPPATTANPAPAAPASTPIPPAITAKPAESPAVPATAPKPPPRPPSTATPAQAPPTATATTTAATPPPALFQPPPQPVIQPPAQPHAPAAGENQTALIAPAAMLQQIAQVLHSARCALADAVLQDSGGLSVNGLSDAATAASLQRQIGSQPGTPPIVWHMQKVDPVFCPALALLRPISVLAGALGPGVGLTLRGNKTVLPDGEAILPRITMPDFAGELRVDYLAHDGSLEHLYPTVADPSAKLVAQPSRRLAAGERLALGDPGLGKPQWEAGTPYGTDMIIAIASSTPLHVAAPRNAENKSDAYLADLGGAIEQARAAGARVSGALLLVDAVPKAKPKAN